MTVVITTAVKEEVAQSSIKSKKVLRKEFGYGW